MALPLNPPHPAVPRLAPAPLLAVALAHAALLAVLLLASDAPEPLIPARPLTVSLLAPATEQPAPQPRPQPAKPASQPQPPVLARRAMPVATATPSVEAPQPTPVPESIATEAPATPIAAVEPTQPTPEPVTPPRPANYLDNPKPPYPALSRRLGEEGIVRLNILVNPDGSVARLEVVKSSGYARLDATALKTVESSWKFEPARQAGKPVAAWVIVPIQFTLRS